VRGLVGLRRQFKIQDYDASGQLSLPEFQQCFDDLKVPGLCASEVEMIFRAYDKDGSGQIDEQEFFDALVGVLPSGRLRLVNEAYESLDTNQDQSLTLDEVKSRFEPSRHPDVKAGL